MRLIRTGSTFPAALIVATALASALSAQTPPSPAPGRGPGRGLNAPKKGVCPLPILASLPEYTDTTFYANTAVPHGKLEPVTYGDKRMQIYTPPDYDTATTSRYPVLYLNHGGGDDDTAWTKGDHVANLILDNLIAAGKAKKMIVVMPDTSKCASATPSAPGKDDVCTQNYLQDIIPYVDTHYRTRANRESRALAGLSMGGFVVMHTGLPHLDTFSELYVYSSGHITEADLKAFEANFQTLLKDPKTNDLFRVPYYMAAGETDIALKNGQKVMALFNANGIRNFWVLSTGGHDWNNWRRYLYQTAQIMFPDCDAK